MGIQKNATYKVHNGTDFDEINFKTTASQVKTAGGSDVETELGGKAQSNMVNFTATLIDGTQLAGSYTRLKFAVNKLCTFFPLTSNAYRIIDDKNNLNTCTLESLDISNNNHNIMQFLVSGGDVRGNFTTSRIYSIL